MYDRLGEFTVPNRVTASGKSMTQTGHAEGTWDEGTWRQSQDKWSKIWFEKMCRFHGRKPQPTWEFTPDDVIAFLRDHLRRKTHAWKRLKIIESLMFYRRHVQAGSLDDFKFIHTKLEALARAEKIKQMCEGEEEEIEDVVGHIDPKEPDVIQNLRRAIRLRHDKLETERAYVYNVRAFMRERGLKCQADFDKISAADVETHLTDMAVDGNVAASTQNRAFYALLYLFEHVLQRKMGEVNSIRASKGKQIPTVLSELEIESILSHLKGVHLVIAKLLYGSGMRISEALRLRMKDFDFDRRVIEVHQSKGDKSRIVPMPEGVVADLRFWMESRRVLHEHDLEQGTASVCLPKALERKYPAAARELRWQFLFASHRLSRDPRTRVLRRHHLHKDTFPAQLRTAVQKAGIDKHVSAHVFRHSFATHLLQSGTDICTIQELLGHADIKTTRIYLHALNRADVKLVSPLDRLVSMSPAAEQPVADQSAVKNSATCDPATEDTAATGLPNERATPKQAAPQQASHEQAVNAKTAQPTREPKALANELARSHLELPKRSDTDDGHLAAERGDRAEPSDSKRCAPPPSARARWWKLVAGWRLRRALAVVGCVLSLLGSPSSLN